jgi:hypothetical protein
MTFWNSYSCFWLITQHVDVGIVFDSANDHSVINASSSRETTVISERTTLTLSLKEGGTPFYYPI